MLQTLRKINGRETELCSPLQALVLGPNLEVLNQPNLRRAVCSNLNKNFQAFQTDSKANGGGPDFETRLETVEVK